MTSGLLSPNHAPHQGGFDDDRARPNATGESQGRASQSLAHPTSGGPTTVEYEHHHGDCNSDSRGSEAGSGPLHSQSTLTTERRVGFASTLDSLSVHGVANAADRSSWSSSGDEPMTSEDDHDHRELESSESAPPRNESCVKRKLARGFTITISAPPQEEDDLAGAADPYSTAGLQPQSTSTADRRGRSGVLPASAWGSGTFSSSFSSGPLDEASTFLSPDELLPDAPLERSESRLPSVEDMLADAELKKLLQTSVVHTQIQEALLETDNDRKHSALMKLVETSFLDPHWRLEAAADRSLVDTLVLFCRQRLCSFSRSTGQLHRQSSRPTATAAPATSSPRSRLLQRASTSSATAPCSSEEPSGILQSPRTGGPRSTGTTFRPRGASGSCLGRSNSTGSSTQGFTCTPFPTTEEQIRVAAVDFALVGTVLKLIRNLCASNPGCQMYIHNHRILELLVANVDAVRLVLGRVKATDKATGTTSDSLDQLASTNHIFKEESTKLGSRTSSIRSDDATTSRPWDHLASFASQISNFEAASPTAAIAVPEWCVAELVRFSRTLVQLITNVVTNLPELQRTFMSFFYPDALVKTAVFSGDPELLFCLMYNFTAKQPFDYVYKLLIEHEKALEVLVLLLCCAIRALWKRDESSNSSSRILDASSNPYLEESGNLSSTTADETSSFVNLFLHSVCRRESNDGTVSFFAVFMDLLLKAEDIPASLRGSLLSMLSRSALPNRSHSRDLSSLSFGSQEGATTADPVEFLVADLDRILFLPGTTMLTKGNILTFFLSSLEAGCFNSMRQARGLSPPPPNANMGRSAASWLYVASLLKDFASVEGPPATDALVPGGPLAAYPQCWEPLLRLVHTMCVSSSANSPLPEAIVPSVVSVTASVTKWLDCIRTTRIRDEAEFRAVVSTATAKATAASEERQLFSNIRGPSSAVLALIPTLLLICASVDHSNVAVRNIFVSHNGPQMIAAYQFLIRSNIPLLPESAAFALRSYLEAELVATAQTRNSPPPRRT